MPIVEYHNLCDPKVSHLREPVGSNFAFRLAVGHDARRTCTDFAIKVSFQESVLLVAIQEIRR